MPKNRLFQVGGELGEGWELSVYDGRLADYEQGGYCAELFEESEGSCSEAWGRSVGAAIIALSKAVKEDGVTLPPPVAEVFDKELKLARSNRGLGRERYMLLGTILKDEGIPAPRHVPT
jgi:hypothetical protein